jgi:hypothetical protein
MKHIRKHIFVYTKTIKLCSTQANLQALFQIYYKYIQSSRTMKYPLVQSQHHRRLKNSLYGVRPCSQARSRVAPSSFPPPSHLKIYQPPRKARRGREKNRYVKTVKLVSAHCYRVEKKLHHGEKRLECTSSRRSVNA